LHSFLIVDENSMPVPVGDLVSITKFARPLQGVENRALVGVTLACTAFVGVQAAAAQVGHGHGFSLLNEADVADSIAPPTPKNAHIVAMANPSSDTLRYQNHSAP
jgi:hypothetical protein